MRHTVFAIVLVLLVVPAFPTAQNPPSCTFNDSPAVTRLRSVLDAVRQGDLAALRQTIETAWTTDSGARDAREEAVVALSRLSLQSDGLSEIRVCTPRPDLAVGVLKNDLTEAVDQVAVQVANTSDAPVTMAQVGLSTRSLSAPPAGTMEERIRNVDDYVSRLAARGAFSGVVLVAHDGNPLTQKLGVKRIARPTRRSRWTRRSTWHRSVR